MSDLHLRMVGLDLEVRVQQSSVLVVDEPKGVSVSSFSVHAEACEAGTFIMARAGSKSFSSYWYGKEILKIREWLPDLVVSSLAAQFLSSEPEAVDVDLLLVGLKLAVVRRRRAKIYSALESRELFESIETYESDLYDDGMVWVKYNAGILHDLLGDDWVNKVPMKNSADSVTALRCAELAKSTLMAHYCS